MAAQLGRVPELSEEAIGQLVAHSWPGNVRELRNAIRSAALVAGNGPILPGHLPPAVHHHQLAGAGEPCALRNMEHEYILQTLERTGGNRSQAARLLNIDRGTLARRLKTVAGENPRKTPDSKRKLN